MITISRLDGKKVTKYYDDSQNLTKISKYVYVSIGDGDERKNLEKLRKELKLEKTELIFKSTEQQKVSLLINRCFCHALCCI